MSDQHPLLEAYLNGELDAEGFAAFNDWLREDPEHLRQWVFAAFLAQQLPDALASQAEEDTITDIASAAQQGHVDAQLLAMLSEMEQKAQPIELPGEAVPEPVEIHDDAGSLSAHDFVAAGSYLLRHILKTKAAAFIGLAALLALAFVLLGPWGGDETPSPMAENQTPQSPAIAARLTAQQDAQWAGQTYTTGDTLQTGQRLDLVAGIAEITTHDGAVAVLQAPCALELLGTNSIRLHTGKMVGIVEVDSAKGFTVRTPHLDITDLGTRFGVDADSMQTQVHVLDGEVEALRPDAAADTDPIVLSTGQSAYTSAGASAVATIDHDADRFAALLPEAIRPAPAPTQGAAGWQIVAINGQPLDTPGAMRIAKQAEGVPWITADRAYPHQKNPETTFTVQTRFDLPQDIDGASATLVLNFDANDRVTEVRLNGRVIEPPANSRDDGHPGMHTMRIDGPLLKDGNTLQLDVVDVNSVGAARWEMRVAWSIELANNETTQPGGQDP